MAACCEETRETYTAVQTFRKLQLRDQMLHVGVRFFVFRVRGPTIPVVRRHHTMFVSKRGEFLLWQK